MPTVGRRGLGGGPTKHQVLGALRPTVGLTTRFRVVTPLTSSVKYGSTLQETSGAGVEASCVQSGEADDAKPFGETSVAERSAPSQKERMLYCLPPVKGKEFFIDNLLVRIHLIWWTSLAPWEFEFPFSVRCKSNCLTKVCSGSEEDSCLRLVHFCITQL